MYILCTFSLTIALDCLCIFSAPIGWMLFLVGTSLHVQQLCVQFLYAQWVELLHLLDCIHNGLYISWCQPPTLRAISATEDIVIVTSDILNFLYLLLMIITSLGVKLLLTLLTAICPLKRSVLNSVCNLQSSSRLANTHRHLLRNLLSSGAYFPPSSLVHPPMPILYVPQLFGHEIIAILCGLVWGLCEGFAIVALGTYLGEVGNF